MGSSARAARQRSCGLALATIRRQKTPPSVPSLIQFFRRGQPTTIYLGAFRAFSTRETRQQDCVVKRTATTERTKDGLWCAKCGECRRKRLVRSNAALDDDVARSLEQRHAVVRHECTVQRRERRSIVRRRGCGANVPAGL